jgi:hypothetical protein
VSTFSVVRYFGIGVAVLLLSAYSSVGVFAAGQACRSGTCTEPNGGGFCNTITFNGGSCDNMDNCYCACVVNDQVTATTDCVATE